MHELEQTLRTTQSAKIRLIATDGVFSMDCDIAKLDQICGLAEQYDALVMVDDSHATGILGATGRGSIEHCGVIGRVDIITSTLGKALGGAGGFTSGHKVIIDLLRQRSRPYLFSNTLAPAIVYTSIKVLDLLSETTALRGNYVTAFSYLVVAQGQARIRVQVSAAHTREQLDQCVEAFTDVGKQYGMI